MAKRILVVEDDADIQGLMRAIFSDASKYQVSCAGDGEEAKRMALSMCPEIILTDVNLPKASGYEVCRFVKSQPALQKVKIVVVTGMAQENDYRKAMENGADCYVKKPFRPRELVEVVTRLLESPG